MWKRIKRLFRSIFGGMISAAEDPALILEQNIRDMKDQIPQMNENIAMIRANVTLLEKELKKLNDEEQKLISNIKAGIQAGKEDIAAGYARTLESVRASKQRAQAQLQVAKQASEKAMNVKKAFMKELDRKTQEAMLAIQEAKRAEWQKQVADTMEQFDVGGIDQTHDEMVSRIEQESAQSEARLDMALDSVDSDKMQIEEAGEELRAQELVKQFKIEMGMVDNSTDNTTSQQQKENA